MVTFSDGQGNVIVRPTIVVTQDCRCERRIEAAANALALQTAKLERLLSEPLTRPLGSMQAPRCFAGDEAVTFVQREQDGNTADAAAPPLHQAVDERSGTPPRRPDPEVDTYLGLRHVRANAHARLASLEAAANSGKRSQLAERGPAQRDRAAQRPTAAAEPVDARRSKRRLCAAELDADDPARHDTAVGRRRHGEPGALDDAYQQTSAVTRAPSCRTVAWTHASACIHSGRPRARLSEHRRIRETRFQKLASGKQALAVAAPRPFDIAAVSSSIDRAHKEL